MPNLLTVTYRVSGNMNEFRMMAASVAPVIAEAAGLKWKIWGLNPDGAGVSAYLFETRETAEAFANGPVVAALKANPNVENVVVAIAPVDAELSRVTRAAFAA